MGCERLSPPAPRFCPQLEHTDAAAEHLLRHLLVDGLTTQGAVARTMAEVGPDPDYESRLLVYPSKG